ncbi:UNVERIFIED_CONTAM: hypothetical protein Slati_2496900 [Sesamum latifolium]|uniref:Uncharacterized protein n=1 Tax=Sesamum latifolium TaxID=2727402 RepID=A0AAW2WEE2_9LAMI
MALRYKGGLHCQECLSLGYVVVDFFQLVGQRLNSEEQSRRLELYLRHQSSSKGLAAYLEILHGSSPNHPKSSAKRFAGRRLMSIVRPPGKRSCTLVWALPQIPYRVTIQNDLSTDAWLKRMYRYLGRGEFSFFLSICWLLWLKCNTKWFRGCELDALSLILYT